MIHLDKNSLKIILENSTLPVLLYFFSPFSPASIHMLQSLKNLEVEYREKLLFYAIDSQNSSLIQSFQIHTVPNLVFLKNQKKFGQLCGYLSQCELKNRLYNYLA